MTLRTQKISSTHIRSAAIMGTPFSRRYNQYLVNFKATDDISDCLPRRSTYSAASSKISRLMFTGLTISEEIFLKVSQKRTNDKHSWYTVRFTGCKPRHVTPQAVRLAHPHLDRLVAYSRLFTSDHRLLPLVRARAPPPNEYADYDKLSATTDAGRTHASSDGRIITMIINDRCRLISIEVE